MNIVYIIGNGFDLRLGMPTSYPDFLAFYKYQEPVYDSTVREWKDRFFQIMKDKQRKGETEWRDLEIAIGQFTSSFTNNKQSFLDFYHDINYSLLKFLSEVERLVGNNFSQEECDQLKSDLMSPYRYLNNREQNNCCKRLGYENWYGNVISFNYTSSLEQLCKESLEIGISYGRKDSSLTFQLNGIRHIHGELNKRAILFGLDNIEQISNKLFREDEDILDVLIKPRGNENIGSLIDTEAHDIIQEADLICMFGTSLGPTDQTWWNYIKKRFMENISVTLLYFLYRSPAEGKPTLPMDNAPQRFARKRVVEALGLDGEEKDYRDRIFVALNTEMFPKRNKQRVLL